MNICATCNDTHMMDKHYGYDVRKVMCTFCPVPCADCRSHPQGAYCDLTPCDCHCHAESHMYKGKRPRTWRLEKRSYGWKVGMPDPRGFWHWSDVLSASRRPKPEIVTAAVQQLENEIRARLQLDAADAARLAREWKP